MVKVENDVLCVHGIFNTFHLRVVCLELFFFIGFNNIFFIFYKKDLQE